MRYLHNSKRIIAGVMSVFMLATSVNMPVIQTVKADETVQEDLDAKEGWETVINEKNPLKIDRYKWKINDEGILKFKPINEGEEVRIHDEKLPWHQERGAEVKTIQFEGNVRITGAAYLFMEMNNLISVSFDNVTFEGTTTPSAQMEKMFYNCKKLEKVDFSKAKFANVTGFINTFCGCESLVETIFEGLVDENRSDITNIEKMYNGCKSLEKSDLQYLDCSKITSAYNAFYGAKAHTCIDLTGFNPNNTNVFSQVCKLKNVTAIKLPKTNDNVDLFNTIINARTNGVWAVKTESGNVKFTDAESFKNYNETASEDTTYVFCPDINNSDLVMVNSATEYNGSEQNDIMELDITYFGKKAIEGVDYTVESVSTDSKYSQKLNIYATESGMFKTGSKISSKSINFKKASVEIVANDTGYEYTGNEITNPPYSFNHGVVDENGNPLEEPTGEVTFTYYTDKSCADEFKMEGKPIEKGNYWCVINLAKKSNFEAATKTIAIRIDVPWVKSSYQSYEYTGEEPLHRGYNILDPVTGKSIKNKVNYSIKYYLDKDYTVEADNFKMPGCYYPVITIEPYGDLIGITEPMHHIDIKKASQTLNARPQVSDYTGKKISYTNYDVIGFLGEDGEPFGPQPTKNPIITYYSDENYTNAISKPVDVGTYYVEVMNRTDKVYFASKKYRTTLTISPADLVVECSDKEVRWTGNPIPYKNYKVYDSNGRLISNPPVKVEYFTDEARTDKMEEIPKDLGTYYIRLTCTGSRNYKEKVFEDLITYKIVQGYQRLDFEYTEVVYDGLPHGINYSLLRDDPNAEVTLVYYIDTERSMKTSEFEGASVEGGEPTVPGFYYVNAIVGATENCTRTSNKTGVLRIKSATNDPREDYCYLCGYNYDGLPHGIFINNESEFELKEVVYLDEEHTIMTGPENGAEYEGGYPTEPGWYFPMLYRLNDDGEYEEIVDWRGKAYMYEIRSFPYTHIIIPWNGQGDMPM